MRQDLRLHLNLADVVMIATKVTNPAFVSLFEATHVRGDEAPVPSEQANDVLRSCGLDQYLHFHTNCHNLVRQPAHPHDHSLSPSPRVIHFPPYPFHLMETAEGGFTTSVHTRGVLSGSSFTHRTSPFWLG